MRIQRRARKAIEALHPVVQDRVLAALEGLQREPRPVGSLKLRGTGGYRIRVGEWRVVYDVDDVVRVVDVSRVGHRRDVYR
jgi:mRNA interferase RelE/StbE